MSNNPDTIDTIVDDMLNEGHTGPADSLEWVQAKMKFYADRIKEAWKRQMSQSWHHREMEELVARHEKEVAELKSNLNGNTVVEACRLLNEEGDPTLCETSKCPFYGDPNGCNHPTGYRQVVPYGNAAALRDALSDACYAMFNFLKTQNGGYEEMARALDKGKAALAVVPQQPSGKDEINVSAMRRALEELAHYDDNDANMDDPFCRDGHDCAKIARAALATIKENKSDCPAPTGNASAMLTALRKLRYLASVEFANKADGIETTDLPQAILYHSQKALSEPLRNCDKFGFLDLARLAFQEVEEMPEGNDDTQMRGWLNRFVEWLFATATEQIGETDESK